MSDELVIRGKRGDFNDYEKFISKFKAAKTTDDCYTPQPIYEAVVDYVFRKGNLAEDTEIVRPFRPNGDYTAEEYPDGCVVIDNPPFSILSKIVVFYVSRGVRFFLFAPTMTLFGTTSASYCTKIVCGVKITYANKAKVNTSFLTNIFGDNAIICDGELYKRLATIDAEINQPTNPVHKIIFPDCVVSAALLEKISKRGIVYTIPASEVAPIKKVGDLAIFGGGYILSAKATAERIAAERAAEKAAERAAAEKAAAEKARATQVKLTLKELRMIDDLDGKIKPFYDQTLF